MAGERYDTIVVGLGPAGATAAYELARRGRNVLALDRSRMPRYKPCGGGLTARVRGFLGDDMDSLAETSVHTIRASYRGRREIDVTSDEPLVYMVTRERFDSELARKAREAGTEIHEGERVTGIRLSDGGCEVATDVGEYRARYVVGADGANGVTADRVGAQVGRYPAVAIESEIVVPDDLHESMGGFVRVDLGAIPNGYGWVFPKRDHLSVGVVSMKPLSRHPGGYYERLLVTAGIAGSVVDEQRHGYRIPIFAERGSVARGRVALVGDAAGLVEPVLGEGIYFALRSGMIAAESVHDALENGDGDLAAYQHRIADELFPEFEAGLRFGGLFYRFPRIVLAMLRRRTASHELVRNLFTGATSYRESAERLTRMLRMR